MGRCCVPMCRGNYDGGPKVRLFSFPSDQKRKAEWQRAVRRDDVDVAQLKDSKVCIPSEISDFRVLVDLLDSVENYTTKKTTPKQDKALGTLKLVISLLEDITNEGLDDDVRFDALLLLKEQCTLCKQCTVPPILFDFCFWTGYFNSCLNPFIYASTSREYKRAFRSILRCQWNKPREVPSFVPPDSWTGTAAHRASCPGASSLRVSMSVIWESGLQPLTLENVQLTPSVRQLLITLLREGGDESDGATIGDTDGLTTEQDDCSAKGKLICVDQ
ncbi:hypothetical protein HPB50_023184 [Hyalomma asiaticum]|uniref:Uncharacterized protein n=1 Tax=Hyalomma asiaticum TaxID=266040 RepID=A0ACB7TN37_HYAAI|nr:hypothetical protein HPB50_023184 [Hyalomma asiaticum]